MNQLRIYTDEKFIDDSGQVEPMLYPFFGMPDPEVNDPAKTRFDEYLTLSKGIFTRTNIETCDVAVFPSPWTQKSKKVTILAKQAAQYGKKILIFFNSDSDEKIPIKNAIILRTSSYHALQRRNEYGLPAWSEDFITHYANGHLQTREKKEKPIVGFCGQLEYRVRNRSHELRQALRHPLHALSMMRVPTTNYNHSIRSKAVAALKNSTTEIETNFIIRQQFWGGAVKNGTLEKNAALSARIEYVNNILASDYVLCARGAGNFSYRLYETLSCGRIPIMIHTDMLLPYEKYIPWSECCVVINAIDINQLPERLLKFHRSLSPDEFIRRQLLCRSIWEKWLSPQGFFKNLYRIILH